MRCLLTICLFVLAGHRVESSLEKSDVPSVKKCKPGITWKEDCNFCFCTDTGVDACTKMLCFKPEDEFFKAPKKPELSSGKQCLPGTTWKSQCNSCWCLDDGYAACTLAFCFGYENEPEKTCAPNTAWKYDCNICRCLTTGQAACTLMACPEPYNEELISEAKNEL